MIRSIRIAGSSPGTCHSHDARSPSTVRSGFIEADFAPVFRFKIQHGGDDSKHLIPATGRSREVANHQIPHQRTINCEKKKIQNYTLCKFKIIILNFMQIQLYPSTLPCEPLSSFSMRTLSRSNSSSLIRTFGGKISFESIYKINLIK